MSTEFINDQWRLPNAWNGSESNVNKQSNYSMDFDGTSGVYIIAGDNSSLGEGYTGYTISAWAKTPSSWESDYNAILTKKYSFYFGLNQNHYLILNPGSGTSFRNYEVTSTTVLNLDTWYHFLVTADGTNVKLYINGSLDKTQAETNTAQNSNTTYAPYIGAYSNSGDFDTWKGQLDAICFFNYALTDGTGGTVNQIAALYGSSSTGIGNPMSLSPKPVAYYPLGDQDAFNGSSYLTPNSSLKDFVFDFDSNSPGDYISAPITTLNSANVCTISFWGKKDASNKQLNVGGWENDSAGVWINWYSNGVLYLTARGPGATSFSVPYTKSYDNNWHHFLGVYDGSSAANCKLYLDGDLVATGSGTAPSSLPATTGDNFQIGALGTTYLSDGKLSNVQIFNSVLPETGSNSIETLYNNGSPLTSMSGFTSLQGWWKLDASDTYDSSTQTWTIEDHAGSNDGTSFGMTQANLVQSDLSFKTSISPFALDFDSASGDYIDCGQNTNLDTGDLSASMWINKDSTSSGIQYVFNNNNGSSVAGFAFAFNSNNVYIERRTRTYRGYTGWKNIGFSADVWNHLSITYNDTSRAFVVYLNGVNVHSSTAIPSTNGTSQNITIGENSGLTGFNFDGKLSNISIWNTSLTSAQVTEIYNEGVPSNLNNHSAYSNLVSWWQLGSNSSFNTNWTVLDEKGSNNGTSSNMGEDAIVDGVGSYANGLSSGMGGDEVVGDAPYSTANSLSVNMDVLDRSTDVPN